MLRRREKTQQILSTSKNTSLEIWLMDLMNEKMESEFEENIFQKAYLWKNWEYFKENSETFKSRFSCQNPIRDKIIIPIILGS